jgi:hypothetical protein
MAWRGSGVRIPSAPQKSQVRAVVQILSVRHAANVGAKLLAFGMAEAKRWAYGEDGIYFDHRRDRDGAYRKTCNGRWPFPGADRQQAEAAACGPGYRARRFGFTSLNGNPPSARRAERVPASRRGPVFVRGYATLKW